MDVTGGAENVSALGIVILFHVTLVLKISDKVPDLDGKASVSALTRSRTALALKAVPTENLIYGCFGRRKAAGVALRSTAVKSIIGSPLINLTAAANHLEL